MYAVAVRSSVGLRVIKLRLQPPSCKTRIEVKDAISEVCCFLLIKLILAVEFFCFHCSFCSRQPMTSWKYCRLELHQLLQFRRITSQGRQTDLLKNCNIRLIMLLASIDVLVHFDLFIISIMLTSNVVIKKPRHVMTTC